MRKPFLILIAVAVLVITSSFVALRAMPQPTIVVADETLWFAERAGFDYLGNLARAEKGDMAALKNILVFSKHEDTAGAYFHCFVLAELLAMLRDDRFVEAARTLNGKEARHVAGMVDGGRLDALNMREAEFARQFPLTNVWMNEVNGEERATRKAWASDNGLRW